MKGEKPKKIIQTSGSNKSLASSQPIKPSPWLDPENVPVPDAKASFVEYLRWMRFPEQYKDATKLELLCKAQNLANYEQRLKRLNSRTRKLAEQGIIFEASSTWRIRVGGQKGPEDMLLPAFDALGMPYIPSSALRGIARTFALRDLINNQSLGLKKAEDSLGAIFGDLDSVNPEERMGKVIFLDAYPVPTKKNGGLSLDIVNNIWSWEGNQPIYKAKPNALFSLLEASFVIGLKPTKNCDNDLLEKVKKWLVEGLEQGIGAQVNAGYGVLTTGREEDESSIVFQTWFYLDGQLIHGRQDFKNWHWDKNKNIWKLDSEPFPEVRPPAFKSILRYWFRAFALGVMTPANVKYWESTIFGGINPEKKLGWLKCNIQMGKLATKAPKATEEGRNDPCGSQEGFLTLCYTYQSPLQKREALKALVTKLVWLMFHLGGIGQGARRPKHSRKSRAPWWRGSSLIPPESESDFWQLPDNIQAFRSLFHMHLKEFYLALYEITSLSIVSTMPKVFAEPDRDKWFDVVDFHCRIVACTGSTKTTKPFALSTLHSPQFKKENRKGNIDYDANLCGAMGIASPIWISNLENEDITYQIVTIFGATVEPRSTYLQKLKDTSEVVQIWPMS
jgi:CRISPR-associated protein Cmr6